MFLSEWCNYFISRSFNWDAIFSAGYEKHPLQLVSASIPDTFEFPGTAKMSYHAIRNQDMPADLVMDFKIRKLALPLTYDVPCRPELGNGGGSW